MEMLRSLNWSSLPLYGHCKDRQQQHQSWFYKVVLPRHSRVFYNLTNTPPVSATSQNTSHFFDDDPSRKSNDSCSYWNNKKPVIDVSLIYNMIKQYTDDGLFEDAIKVYLDLLQLGFPVVEFRFFPCLVKAFGGLCDVEKCHQIHGHLLKFGLLDDLYVENAVLGMYWKCGAVEDSIEIFEKMRERDLVSWNTMISGFCRSGDFVNSLNIFGRMIQEGVCPNRVACLSALSACAAAESLTCGREIHGFILRNRLHLDEYLVSKLIEMYMKCGDVKNAANVFRNVLDEEVMRGNRVVWNVMILGYVSNGCPLLAMDLLFEMLELGFSLDSSTVVAVLVLCSQLLDLSIGKQIHGVLLRFGLEDDIRVVTALMEMYFKCGDPETGLKIFRKFKNRNLVMWGSVISNCSQYGYPIEAVQLFRDFTFGGFPDSVILLAALRACSSLVHRPWGIQLHGLATKLGFDSDIFVGGALVDLYGKCGDMKSAGEVFHGLPARDLISWNALVSGFAQNECTGKALKAFHDMQSEQVKPNTVTVACILSVCSHFSVMKLCKEVHCYVLRHGFEKNILVSNSLISTYSKCGDINSSWTVFEKMPARNDVSWNSIILGFGMHGRTDKMFAIFEQMKAAGVKPDHATFTALLSACSHAGNVEMGWKYFCSFVEDYNLEPRLEQYTCMVDLLGRAGLLSQAYNLIMAMPCSPDARIWGSLLGSCKIYGDVKLAEVVANHIFEFDPKSIGYLVLLANLYEDSGKWDEVTRVRSEIKSHGLQKQPGCSWIEVNNDIHTFIAGDCSHDQSDMIYCTINNLTLEMKEAGYIPSRQSASNDVSVCG